MSQDRLDPIDWATYEPYFWGNVQRHSQRVSILFGTLLQLQRSLPDSSAASKVSSATATPTSSTESNPLNLLPVAPRFQYLPISAPSVGVPITSGGSASGLGLSGGSRQPSGAYLLGSTYASPSANSSEALSSDLAGNFSFADLGTGATSGRLGGEGGGTSSSAAGGGLGEAATAGMAAGAYALSAFQARLQAGFGTMLGDKAAEMTALAQQRLDFTAIGSGLLGQGYGGLFATKPGGGS